MFGLEDEPGILNSINKVLTMKKGIYIFKGCCLAVIKRRR